MSGELVFNLFYLLISFGIIYPPPEFISAGFTIQNWFSNLLGSEKERFIRFHIKKSMLNLFVYSCLPLIYLALLFLFGFVDKLSSLFIGNTLYWKIFAASSIAAPFLALFEIKKWSDNNFKDHPIVKNLGKCCNNNNTWEAVATDIENEFRRLFVVCISTNPIVNVVITENWILKVTPMTIFVTHQSDATLSVKEAHNYNMTQISSDAAQFLNIEVKSSRAEAFTIRINSSDFKSLENSLSRSINILPNVKFHKSITEQFFDVFKETIEKNPRYYTNLNNEDDQCIGCLQASPGIKLQKQCQDIEGHPSSNCTNCFCRPMWCVKCITKWFVSRQDPEQKNQWLSSKCTCPMCRATFCVLDVSLLNNANAEE